MIDIYFAKKLDELLKGSETTWRDWCYQNFNLKQNQLEFIEAVIQSKLQKNPEDAYALTLSAVLHSRSNNKEQAINLYKQAAEQGSIVALNLLALSYHNDQQYDEASAFLGQAIITGSLWAKSIYSASKYRYHRLFQEQIKSHAEQRVGTTEVLQDEYILKLVNFILENEDNNSPFYYYKMRVLFQCGENAAAIQCCEQYVAEDNLTADDLHNLANIYYAENEIKKACVFFYKTALKEEDPKKTLQTLCRALREDANNNGATLHVWDTHDEITKEDHKLLALFILDYSEQFNAEEFVKFLETEKPALQALITEEKLTFNRLAEIALKKEKRVKRELVRHYYLEHWDTFKMHLQQVTAYILDCHNDDLVPFFSSLTPEQQRDLWNFISQSVQENSRQHALIRTYNNWESNLYLLLSWSRHVWAIIGETSEAIKDLTHFYSYQRSLPLTNLFLHVLLIPSVALAAAASSLLLFTFGLAPALAGLAFRITIALIANNLQQLNAEYGGPEKLNTLHANLKFFQPAMSSDFQQTDKTLEEVPTDIKSSVI